LVRLSGEEGLQVSAPVSDDVEWFDNYAPPDSVLRKLVSTVVAAAKPQTACWASKEGEEECRAKLSQWISTLIPNEFHPDKDRDAVTEQAELLVSIEGTGTYVNAYIEPKGPDGCAPDLLKRRARLRGIELYGRAFAALAVQHGITRRIPVYRALTRPMRSSTRLQSVSWNPAHMSGTCAQWLYQAEIGPTAVAGISVGQELHPVVAAPIGEWRLVSSPPATGSQR
jgi:hypothetical protein